MVSLAKQIELAKGKFCRLILKSKISFILGFVFFSIYFSNNYAKANFQEKFINKYKTINTLSFDFKQKIGEKVEFGKCHIKYPLLMKCEYPKKKKSIIANGKKFAIIKKRYKKIYHYPLKKTPLFYLLEKNNFLDLVKNYKPSKIGPDIIEYKVVDKNSSELKIFFEESSLNLLGWRTLDSYSNEVIFNIRNIKENLLIKNDFFDIPNQEDL